MGNYLEVQKLCSKNLTIEIGIFIAIYKGNEYENNK